jgi:hypothetical protein
MIQKIVETEDRAPDEPYDRPVNDNAPRNKEHDFMDTFDTYRDRWFFVLTGEKSA